MKAHIGRNVLRTWTRNRGDVGVTDSWYGRVLVPLCGTRRARMADDPREATCVRCNRMMAAALRAVGADVEENE